MHTYFSKKQVAFVGIFVFALVSVVAIPSFNAYALTWGSSSMYLDGTQTHLDGSGGGGSSYVNTTSQCGNGDPVDLNGDGMYSQDEIGCSCNIQSSYGDWSFNYWNTEPAPVCTLDLTADKITWTTHNATQVLISPLTNSPEVPGFGSYQGTIKDIIFSGDFHTEFRQPNLSLIQQDINNHGGNFTITNSAGFYANQLTADRLCSLLDPNAKATSYHTSSFVSPEDNYMILWDGSSWKRYGAKYYNKGLRYQFTCATFESVDSYPLNGTYDFNPDLGIGTHTYKLVAVGPGGSKECTDTVTVSEPDPVPVCTLDLFEDKLVWTTDYATTVDIEPLTNSPEIPKTVGGSSGSSVTIFSGDFHSAYWLVYKNTKVATDAYTYGGVSIGNAEPYADQATANRLCSLLDPQATATSWRADSYSSPSNNSIIKWTGSSWKKYSASLYNKHLRYNFTCTKTTSGTPTSYPLDGTHYFNPELGPGTHSYKLTATGPGGAKMCTDTITIEEPEPEPKGSIKVCKLIIDKDDNLVTGSENNGVFSIEVAGITVTFDTPLSFTHDLIDDYYNHKDAECVVYDDLELGTYTYGEEQITGNNWETPLYNDGFTMQVDDLNDFLPYQPSGSNDADGEIVLTKERPHRVLSILNQYKKDEQTPPQVPACAFADKDGRIIIDFNTNDKLRSDLGSAKAFGTSVYTQIPAGTYKVSLMGWDGYLGRENHSQPHEQYQVKLKNGYDIVDITSAHSDLADNVVQASVAEVVNHELVLDETITKVVPFHAFYPDTTNPNSVVPICAAFDRVEEPEAPTCDMEVSPYKIHEGDSAILSWTSTGADTVTIDQGIGSVNANGSESVSPDETTVYTGTFTGPGGTKTCSAKLKVKEGSGEPSVPQCHLSASPKTFPYGGGKTTISWTTTNAKEGSITDNVGDPDERDLDPIGSGSFEVQVDTTTVFTAEVVSKKGGTASCAVTVKVEQQSCSNCGGGGGGVPFDPHTSLTHRDVASPQPLTGQIYLNQVPYTGFATGPLGAALFWLTILGISAVLSYFVVQRNLFQHILSLLAYSGSVARGVTGQTTQAETDFADYLGHQGVGAHHWKNTPAHMTADQNYNLSHGAGLGSLSGGGSDIAQQLEERAHKENILISSEGLSTIITQGGNSSVQSLSILEQVIEKAKELYPREDGWILLNSERVQTILSQVGGSGSTAAPMPTYDEPVSAYTPPVQTSPQASDQQPTASLSYTPPVQEPVAPQPQQPAYDDYAPTPPVTPPSYDEPQYSATPEPMAYTPQPDSMQTGTPEMRDVPTFVDYLLNGREHEAFTFLRSISAEGRDEREFLTQVMVALDSVYKHRIEGGGMRPDAAVLAKTDRIGTQTLERILEILADCVDHSYSSSKLGAKIAVTKVFECLAGKL